MEFMQKLRRTLIDGLIVILPIGLTAYIVWLGYNLIDSLLGKNTPVGSQLSDSLKALFGVEWIPGLSIIYTGIIIILLGLLSRFYLWSVLQRYVDALLKRIPIVKKIYTPAQEIVEAILGQKGLSSFKEPVLIEYPRKGIYTIGFITNKFQDKSAVYVFTTPDPFTGKILIIPKDDYQSLDLDVEEAFRVIISMGISTNKSDSSDFGEKLENMQEVGKSDDST